MADRSLERPPADRRAWRIMAFGGVPHLTPTGLTAVAAGVALAILGWSLGYLVLTVVAVGVGMALTVGAVIAAGVPDLEVRELVEPARVERGRPAVALVSIHNRGRRRSRACTAVEAVDDDPVCRPVRSLRPGRSLVVRFPLPTDRRGAVAVGPVSLTVADPLGLWAARRVVGRATTLFVEPRIHPIDARPGGRTRQVDGPMNDGAPRGSLTFLSLREYVPGDDIRRVHWRSTARTGTLMVREHVDSSLPSTVVVLDTRPGSYQTDERGRSSFEDAVDVAASIVAASQRERHPIRLLTTDGVSLLARAGHRGQELHDHLAAVQPVDGGSLGRLAADLAQLRGRDAIAVVGGGLDGAELATVTELVALFGTATLVTVRPPSADAPRWSGGRHIDGVTATAVLAHWPSASRRGREGWAP